MSSTLTPTCTFCRLRFASRPLLELHVREDHLQRDHHAEPDGGDAASAQASQPRADGPVRRHSQPSTPPRITKEVSTMTAAPQRHRLRTRRVMSPLRGIIRTIRDLHAELVLASEAMLRPVGAPRPGSRADMPPSPPEHEGAVTRRAQRAA